MITAPKAVVLLSGGLDSYTAAAIAKADGFELYALTVSYGQVHSGELEAARRVADFLGVNDLLGNFDHWLQRRAEVQSRRERPDAEILPLFEDPLWCIEDERTYAELHQGLVGLLGLDELFGRA